MRAAESCLPCHSTVDAAPKTMIERYGPANGFGWILNDVIAAQIISVPTEIPVARAKEAFTVFMSSVGVHGLSTNGRAPFTEDDPYDPQSVYAETKVKAEQFVLRNPRHTVIRTGLTVGVSPTGDRAFTEQMKLAWKRGETLHLFVDEFRCPIPAVVTARATWELIKQSCTGLYHVAGAERLSRWEIGRLIAARCEELNPKLEPASAKDYFVTPRPADVSLNCAKVQKLLSFPLPKLSEWLGANPEEPI
jgi:dTDP-4-dehydrorhamnose reductase